MHADITQENNLNTHKVT